MKKLRFYLQGVEFLIITEDKAIEEMKNKKEFGSGRVHRWFERLERFQCKIQYGKESEKVVPDAYSRSSSPNFEEREDEIKLKLEKILQIHADLNHRKIICDDLRRKGFTISSDKLKNVIEKCYTCKIKDKDCRKTCN